MQDAASVHHTLCKHVVHPSCPGQGVAGKAGDLGTPRLHAVPMPNPPPRQSTRRPPPPLFSGRSGARSRFPARGIFKQLLPALGRWHQQPGLEPGIRRECGKRLAGGQGRRGWSIPDRERRGQPKRDGGLDGRMAEGMDEQDGQEPTAPHHCDTGVYPRDSARVPPSLPRAWQSSATFTSQPFPTTAPPRSPRITPAAAARSQRRPARPQRAG